MIFGENELKKIYERIRSVSKFDKFDVLMETFDRKLTRFANSVIHQNVAEKNVSILLRGVTGGKVGIASINSFEPAKLDALVRNVETIISLKKDKEEAEIPEKWEDVPVYTQFWNEATAKFTPAQMADAVGVILKKARAGKLDAFGALEISLSELFLANSFGLTRYCPNTMSAINITAMGDNYSYAGLATDRNCDISKIDFTALADEACGICQRAKAPRDAEPGRYDVVLSNQAAAELVGFLAYLGFPAKSYQEKRSFLCGKLGQKICGDNITIVDDGMNVDGQPMPFDFEGTKKEKVVLVENGVAKNLVYDIKTARTDGKRSTGHAMPANSSYGPVPGNIFLAPGKATKEEMIKSTKKGLLITSFHYVNVVDPRETVITGMTRNGTFMIENGEVTYPIKNLRFTQNVCDALSAVEMVGCDAKLTDAFGVHAPSLKVKGFNFTSKTEF